MLEVWQECNIGLDRWLDLSQLSFMLVLFTCMLMDKNRWRRGIHGLLWNTCGVLIIFIFAHVSCGVAVYPYHHGEWPITWMLWLDIASSAIMEAIYHILWQLNFCPLNGSEIYQKITFGQSKQIQILSIEAILSPIEYYSTIQAKPIWGHDYRKKN